MDNKKIIDTYNDMGSNPVDNIVYAQSSKPIPTQSDYNTGVLTRYFVQKINESIVQEVSFENYNQVSNMLYKKVSLKWKITGLQKSKTSGKIVEVVGVEEFNRGSVFEASNTIDGLISVITNYLEYWRGY